MASVLQVATIKDQGGNANAIEIANSSANVTINNLAGGTIGSNVTFPAGHIVQSVFNPTITNTSTTQNTSTTSVGVADVIGQISISSGNGVLIYVQAELAVITNTNSYGRIEIREGTVASLGDVIVRQRNGLASGTSQNTSFTFLGFDSSPADTTPDYVVAVAKDSSSTTSAGLDSIASEKFKIFLFEVKQ